MMPAESASAFRGFLLARRVDIDAAALDEIAGAALDFYSTVSTSGLAAAAEADMLLFQVGLYDWGNGEHFRLMAGRPPLEPRSVPPYRRTPSCCPGDPDVR
jgi:hypothetical protein